MKSKKLFFTCVVSVLIVTFGFVTVVSAASTKKMLEAWYGAKIIYNNQELISDVQPFIVNGTTYVPLRMLMNTIGKDISWDGVNSKVLIADRPNTTEIDLRTQLSIKDVQISDLQAKISALEKKGSSSSGSSDLSDLEENLNDDYEDYKSKSFEITLDGDEDDIEVEIIVSSSDWNGLSSSNQTTLLQNICDDIRDEYDDARITGVVKKSSSTSSAMAYFYLNSNDTVRMNSDEDILNLEQELDDTYRDKFDDYDIPVYLTLSGDEDDLEYRVYFKYSSYDDEWTDISNTKINNLMSSIYSDIEDEFDDAEIEGYICDTGSKGTLASYYKASSGSMTFIRHVN